MLKLRLIYIVSLVFIFTANICLGAEWFKEYENGRKAMQQQQWRQAADFFKIALKGNAVDKKKVRTYGMHFIEYYPNRELGICLYNLGNTTEAQHYLKISVDQEPSQRANEYLKQISGGVPPPPVKVDQKKKIVKDEAKEVESLLEETELIVGKKTIKLVGERLGVAILPFENKGASRDLGEIVLDKMITVLVNQERFKVMERAQLDKILAEQSLGSSGVIDATTAAQIGKGIGVDAIIIGSVAATVSGAISVDARVIDTESAAIVVAQDAYSGSSDAQSVKNAVENLTRKITESLPLVEGYIIRIDGEQLILDVGRVGGLKRGMKCVVYKEGAPIKHPITGEILGKETRIMGEVLVTESFDKYCVAKAIQTVAGAISVGDKFLTK